MLQGYEPMDRLATECLVEKSPMQTPHVPIFQEDSTEIPSTPTVDNHISTTE